jgi:acetyl-CoA synthetase
VRIATEIPNISLITRRLSASPSTASGKIMRRILRKIAEGETDKIGDTSTLLNPEIVDLIIAGIL